jgi:tRNA G18 (ribose-2'-O)-methylase SpoU
LLVRIEGDCGDTARPRCSAVEISMVGTGSSLNVAVAGSLVLYKLAGLL